MRGHHRPTASYPATPSSSPATPGRRRHVAVGLLYKAAGIELARLSRSAPPSSGRGRRGAAAQLNVLRVVQKDDIIPLLPMSRPFVRKPYVHLDEGIMLDNDVQVSTRPSPESGATRVSSGGSGAPDRRGRPEIPDGTRGRRRLRRSIDATMDAADTSPAGRARWWQARATRQQTALSEAIDKRRKRPPRRRPSIRRDVIVRGSRALRDEPRRAHRRTRVGG